MSRWVGGGGGGGGIPCKLPLDPLSMNGGELTANLYSPPTLIGAGYQQMIPPSNGHFYECFSH